MHFSSKQLKQAVNTAQVDMANFLANSFSYLKYGNE